MGPPGDNNLQFIVYSLLVEVRSIKALRHVVRAGIAGRKERELIVYSLQLAKGGEGERL